MHDHQLGIDRLQKLKWSERVQRSRPTSAPLPVRALMVGRPTIVCGIVTLLAVQRNSYHRRCARCARTARGQ